MKPVIIYTTTNSKEEAKTLGNHLVKNGLAACVNIVPKIESIYMWNNELCQDSEFLLMIKTDGKLKNEVQDMICKHHSYEVPEVIMVNIEGGSPKYLDWLENNLKKSTHV
ncbi:MAG: divalent-cation tolerance protein CutA [Candidatus Marinimicrobia bacterium]|jgi:periplasmic divalent cation tolerance protein|nr:divalent-cation tolerance protein CutA [Candidatus Neomarinimicrobiota bacterium]MDP6611056.1 divalent-cation tolerance protein CutA [Candidatus Neomarinimicrobiota bacterium]|tara:strand:- start:39719 stop:40048 length:330 start_codon:yes stop_codon:yes gene_type:complete